MTMNCCLQFNPLIASFFSTETAFLKVVTDILAALDRGQISLLGMFDLSAAFDTVDHSILLRRLEICFGIRGAALEWFSSYLTGGSQQRSVLSRHLWGGGENSPPPGIQSPPQKK